MEKDYLKIQQNTLVLYIVSCTTEELLEATEIKHYNSATSEGYQRPPFPSHYKKIAKYLNSDTMPVLPTSILTAIDPKQIKEEGPKLNISGKLRVVDGQHRIEGIRYLKNTDLSHYNSIKQYEFPVIIMAIDNNMQELEINTFININSKGKRVSTDLALELKEKINREKISQIKDSKDLTPEQCENIATRIAHKLNSNEKSVWFESIRSGDEFKVTKPISVTAFTKSITEVVSIISASDKQMDVAVLTENITNLLVDVWDTVKGKWKPCFEVTNEDYNIKKGIGVYSIHLILKECALNNKGEISSTLRDFKTVIQNSQAVHTDWMTGGRFTGMSSGQALKRISSYLKNEVKREEF